MTARRSQRAVRPYKTLYYDDPQAVAYVSQGHSKTEPGAMRQAVFRLLIGWHKRAEVYHEGVLVYNLLNDRGRLRVGYGRA